MSVPDEPAPAVDCTMPLQLLAACHLHLRAHCTALRRLVTRLRQHGADAQAREGAGAVMRIFDIAAPLHHADEESDLFPALLESMAGSDAVCLRDLTTALSAEHCELQRRWHSLRRALEQVGSGDASALSADEVAG